MAAAAELMGLETGIALLLGLVGPLAAAAASWVISERTWQRRPEALTSVMIAAFGAKVVFFGAYVAVMIGVLSLRTVPFVASFTVSFIALHLLEAFALRRLFTGAADSGSRIADRG